MLQGVGILTSDRFVSVGIAASIVPPVGAVEELLGSGGVPRRWRLLKAGFPDQRQTIILGASKPGDAADYGDRTSHPDISIQSPD
jgi:hypothetical protein